MPLLATPLINTGALWKIALAALAGGAGVVIAFGIRGPSRSAAPASV